MSTETVNPIAAWNAERALLRQRLVSRAMVGEGVRFGDFRTLGYEETFFKDEGEHGMSLLRKDGEEPRISEYESREAYEDDKRQAHGAVGALLFEETTWTELRAKYDLHSA